MKSILKACGQGSGIWHAIKEAGVVTYGAPQAPGHNYGEEIAGAGALGSAVGGHHLARRGAALGKFQSVADQAKRVRGFSDAIRPFAETNVYGLPQQAQEKLHSNLDAAFKQNPEYAAMKRTPANTVLRVAEQDAAKQEATLAKSGFGKGISKYLSPQAMQTTGKVLRGAGVVGSGAYLGKKLYDLFSD